MNVNSWSDKVLARAWESGYNWIVVADRKDFLLNKGKHFFYTDYFDVINNPSGVAIGLFTTGCSVLLDTRFGINDAARFLIYEDVVFTSTGVEVSSYNNNRDSKETTNLIVYSGVSPYDVTASGLLLDQRYNGATSYSGKITSRDNMILLKRNTYYMVHLIPDGDGKKASIRLDWCSQ